MVADFCCTMKQIIDALKQNYRLPLALALVGALAFSSCSNSNNDTSNTPVDENQLKDGAWKITYFWDKDHEETAHFNDYILLFNNDGTVDADDGSVHHGGTWSTGNDDSQAKLVLNFTTDPFSEISDDWHVIDQSTNIMHLEDVSGGNGTTELLTLEKI